MAGIKHFINFEILEGLYCLGFSWWMFCCLSVFVGMMVYSLTSGIVCSYLLLFVLHRSSQWAVFSCVDEFFRVPVGALLEISVHCSFLHGPEATTFTYISISIPRSEPKSVSLPCVVSGSGIFTGLVSKAQYA